MTVVGHVLVLRIYLPVGNPHKNVDYYSTFLDLFTSCPGQGILTIPGIPVQECITPHDGESCYEVLVSLGQDPLDSLLRDVLLGTIVSVSET